MREGIDVSAYSIIQRVSALQPPPVKRVLALIEREIALHPDQFPESGARRQQN